MPHMARRAAADTVLATLLHPAKVDPKSGMLTVTILQAPGDGQLSPLFQQLDAARMAMGRSSRFPTPANVP